MGYDLQAARDAGVKDEDIEKSLASHYSNYDFEGAKKAGIKLDDIVSAINNREKQGGDSNDTNEKNTQRQTGTTELDNGGQDSEQGQLSPQDRNGVHPDDQVQRVQDDTSSVNSGSGEGQQTSPSDVKVAQATAFAHGLGKGSAMLAGGLATAGSLEVPNATIAGFTGPFFPLTEGALNVAEFWAGSYMGAKAHGGIEKAAGKVLPSNQAYVDQASKDHPTSEMIGETIPMAAQGVYSASNLIKLAKAEPTLKDAAMKIGAKVLGGAAGGAAVEAVGRPAFDKAVNVLESHVTGDPEKPTISPTGQSILEAAGWGVLLSAAHDPGVSRAEVKSILEQAPTAALKTVAADPQFRKSWKYNSKWIDDELTKRDAKENALPETAKVIGVAMPTPPEAEVQRPDVPTEDQPSPTPRIAAAAYKNPQTGSVSEGASHIEAMKNAGFSEEDIPKEAADRETPDFGFTDTEGNFHSREEAEQIAKDAGQHEKVSDRPVMHSDDVKEMDKYPVLESGKKPEPLPGAATVGEFEKKAVIDAVRDIQNESRKGSPLDKDNKSHFDTWSEYFKSKYDEDRFSDDDLKRIWGKD